MSQVKCVVKCRSQIAPTGCSPHLESTKRKRCSNPPKPRRREPRQSTHCYHLFCSPACSASTLRQAYRLVSITNCGKESDTVSAEYNVYEAIALRQWDVIREANCFWDCWFVPQEASTNCSLEALKAPYLSEDLGDTSTISWSKQYKRMWLAKDREDKSVCILLHRVILSPDSNNVGIVKGILSPNGKIY